MPSLNSRAECRSIGVSTEPGHTAFTRTPYGASSIAIARTSAPSAPLPAVYAATFACVATACTDDTTTIAPFPERRRCGRAARAARKTPLTFTANTSSQVFSSVSATVPYRWIPAEVTSTSSRPKASTAFSAARATAGRHVCDHRDGLPAGRGDRLDGLGRVTLPQPVDRHRGPGGGEQLGHGPADPARPAGDQGDPPRVHAQPPAAIVLTGAPATGKSTLAREIARPARRRGASTRTWRPARWSRSSPGSWGPRT